MGQYWKAVVLTERSEIDGRNHMQVFRPRDVNEGMKLMEHAYDHNAFVAEVWCAIMDSSRFSETTRAAWVGDYSEDWYRPSDEVRYNAHREAWPACWGLYACMHSHRYGNHEEGYILDEDRMEYIEAPELGASRGVSNLAILLAVGNGAGGGDYRGRFKEMAGRWAYDHLRWSKYRPGSDWTLIPNGTFREGSE